MGTLKVIIWNAYKVSKKNTIIKNFEIPGNVLLIFRSPVEEGQLPINILKEKNI